MSSSRLTNWQRVWERRGLDDAAVPSLETVMKIDGFEATDAEAWINGIAQTRARLGIVAGDSIFEVGCGAGAFLYPLVHQFQHRVGGIDYSSSLVDVARRAMPGMPFEVQEAGFLDVEEQYDFVVAHSTFQYFPALAYAENVLERMIAKSRKGVAVLDVSDAARQSELESLRRELAGERDYEKRYRGLDHLYYERSWFLEFARVAGMTAEVLEQDIPTYGTAGLRFNVMISRTDLSR